MTAYLLLHNPRYSRLDETASNWSTGSSKSIQPRDRLFFRQTGEGVPHGIIASAWAESDCWEGEHWIEPDKTAIYVDLRIDTIVAERHMLPESLLKRDFPSLLKPMAGGTRIAPDVADRLETIWKEHLTKVPFTRGSPESAEAAHESAPPDPGAEDRTLAAFLDVATPVLVMQGQRLKRALELSRTRLAPFNDPILIDAGRHEWLLRGGHETSFSDWLAWAVERIREPSRVLALFGLEDACGQDAGSQGLDVQREVLVPHGHEKQAGRLDLVIRAPGLLLVAEMKRTREEEADTKKQEGYRLWVDEQPEPEKHCVLVVKDVRDKSSAGGFRCVGWETIAQGLRREAAALMARDDPAGAGVLVMMTAVIEQHLLRFPRDLAGLALSSERVAIGSWLPKHVEAGLGKEAEMVDAESDKNSRASLVSKGSREYLRVFQALNAFEDALFDLCEEVWSSRSEPLEQWFGTGSPVPGQAPDNGVEAAWLGVIGVTESGAQLQVGLRWLLDREEGAPIAEVMLVVPEPQWTSAAAMLGTCKGLERNEATRAFWFGDSLGDGTEPEKIRSALEGLVDRWISTVQEAGVLSGMLCRAP